MVKKELMDILACPLDHKPVQLRGEQLVCTGCGLKFPVKDDIPVMLLDEAELPNGVTSIEELESKVGDGSD